MSNKNIKTGLIDKKVKSEDERKKTADPESDEEDNSSEDAPQKPSKKQSKGQDKVQGKQNKQQDSQSEDETSEDDKQGSKKGAPSNKGPGKKGSSFEDDDDDEEIKEDKSLASRSSGGQQSTEVIIKGLNFKADDEDLGNFLQKQFGEVSRINLLKNEDGRSKGIAFVTFKNEDSANKAIQNSNIEFMERPLFIERTKPKGDRPAQQQHQQQSVSEDSTTIFVGNLFFKTEADTLKKFFSSCGSVVDARIAQKDGKSRGFGHVEFSDKRGVEKALKKQGETIDGRSIKVDVASQRQKGGYSGGNSRGGSDSYSNNRGGNGGGYNRGGSRGGSRNDYSNDRRGNNSGYQAKSY